MTTSELKEVLDKHLKWLRNEIGGSRADLSCANLYGADLSCANLSRADLSCANLYGANLSCADLYGANLYGANLYGADLSHADLSNADLYGANLSHANLYGANLELQLLNKFFPIACPETGSFIAWKKCCNKLIVKLEVLEDAKRSSAYGRKCRCSAAKVLAIENIDGTQSELQEVGSIYDPWFVYRIGKIVSVDNFDEDRRNECAPGIHFFITRQEAVEYVG